MILDVRLVVDRDGRVRASIDGRRTFELGTSSIPCALERLANRIEGASWSSGRPVVDEIADPASPIYARAQTGNAAGLAGPSHRETPAREGTT